MELNKNKVGLSLGILSLAGHGVWMIMIAIGFAERILSWWKAYHFISPTYTLLEFNFFTSILGLVGAFVTAFVVGWAFAFIYNKLNGGKNEKIKIGD